VSDIFAAGLYPVCVATHDQGVRRLFDLSTLLLLLDCQPGDRVLDLGAGPGFSSEMLARLGYEVVAADPDFIALGHNRRRPSLDRERIVGNVQAVVSKAEALPFCDRAFDGVLGMNVLHHIPSLRDVVKELARVLRPGRRAVFCEPGLDHLQELETRKAVREHGEGDRAFDVVEFLRIAQEEGFRETMLSATLQAPLSLVRLDELETFSSGGGPRPYLTPSGILHELRHKHAYAMVVRSGNRERTSRHPGELRAAISTWTKELTAVAGETIRVGLTAENVGDTTWLATPSPLGGFVTLGCKLLRDDGRLVSDALGRTFLPNNVAPREALTTYLSLQLPADLGAGRYRLEIDLVNELRNWFSDLDPAPLPHVALNVRKAPGSQ
jgi:SAM-dependent methyltransferase